MKKTTKHHFFAAIYRYQNLGREILQGLIITLSHWPVLPIIVFSRKNMGERHYSLAASLTYFAILSLPFLFRKEFRYAGDFFELFNWFMLIFMFVFLLFSIIRRLEFKRNSQEFDPNKFSFYEGDRYIFFFTKEKFRDNALITRILSSIFITKHFEGLSAVAIGILFTAFPFSAAVGVLLILGGLLYIGRTNVMYSRGRQFVLDQYDNLIVSAEFAEAFVENKEPKDCRFLDLSILPRSKEEKINRKLCDLINAQSVRTESE